MNPRPLRTAGQALIEAIALVGRGTYKLGARDVEAQQELFDCNSFAIRHCYGIPGHRPGFNRGWHADAIDVGGATVVDDINSNSAAEDARHARDLFELVTGDPQPGDLLVYPTIHLPNIPKPWIGHVAICVNAARAAGHWDPAAPKFALLDIVECVGPNGRRPAIRRSTGAGFDAHSLTWPKPHHRSWLIRVRP